MIIKIHKQLFSIIKSTCTFTFIFIQTKLLITIIFNIPHITRTHIYCTDKNISTI